MYVIRLFCADIAVTLRKSNYFYIIVSVTYLYKI